MSQERLTLCDGAEMLFVESDRFNTTLISFNFYLPIVPENMAANALIPFVLTTCGKNYSDFSKLNFTLGKLYGANLFSSSEKVGDFQLLKVGISVINDRFALDGEKIVSQATDLLLDLIFNPKVENGAFCKEDLEREKRRAIEHIKGEMSEKRIWAKRRLIDEMFKDDIYGTPKCGNEKDVAAITGERLFFAWENMLKNAFIRVNVISEKCSEELFLKLKEKFSSFKRNGEFSFESRPVEPKGEVKTVKEYMNVAQGKLCIGFSSKIHGGDREAAALTVMCDIFGGGPYSRLFKYVREKMSLCYYCSASPIKAKGAIIVSSGIETENANLAQKEICKQLEIMKSGDFTDEEFSSSKKSIIDSFATFTDSQATLDTWYSVKVANDKAYTPDECARFIEAVTKEDVLSAARGVELHTVYMLLPEVGR